MALAQDMHLQQIEHTRGKHESLPSVIAQPETLDAWRHERMYAPLLPLVQALPEGNWLTIGDSGADAFWLRKIGADKITASSIDDSQLQHLGENGYLSGIELRTINAEQIDIPNESYDFVCCKEAYHHFARPPVGFYEMLRVSRCGVILLVEPNGEPQRRILDTARRWIKLGLRRNTEMSNPDFESSGNFIFGPSLHEARKMATALQLDSIYYSYQSDFYVPWLARAGRSNRTASFVIKMAISTQNILSRMRLMSWARITLIVFKTPPSPEMRTALSEAGMRRIDVPRNPYL